jgi:hypothetical protein
MFSSLCSKTVREQASMADLARRSQVQLSQILCMAEQLLEWTGFAHLLMRVRARTRPRASDGN